MLVNGYERLAINKTLGYVLTASGEIRRLWGGGGVGQDGRVRDCGSTGEDCSKWEGNLTRLLAMSPSRALCLLQNMPLDTTSSSIIEI